MPPAEAPTPTALSRVAPRGPRPIPGVSSGSIGGGRLAWQAAMRGATVASAIALLLASGGDLGAGEVGPALDASVGVGGLSLGGVGAIAFPRVGLGLPGGRPAVPRPAP